MHAATADGSTCTPSRRAIHAAAASRNAGVPTDGGYPRSAPDRASASTTAAGGGSNGVPIDRSTAPPSCSAATARRGSSRSYG